jgi:hypothetical protein
MSKYAELHENVYPIFGTDEWKAEKIKTFPANHTGTSKVNTSGEFIRVSVIPSGNSLNIKSISGVLIIDIFTKAGNGPNRYYTIADRLDTYLSGRALSATSGKNVQLFASSLQPSGLDKDDPTLFRTTYSIPFNYTEVM